MQDKQTLLQRCRGYHGFKTLELTCAMSLQAALVLSHMRETGRILATEDVGFAISKSAPIETESSVVLSEVGVCIHLVSPLLI